MFQYGHTIKCFLELAGCHGYLSRLVLLHFTCGLFWVACSMLVYDGATWSLRYQVQKNLQMHLLKIFYAPTGLASWYIGSG